MNGKGNSNINRRMGNGNEDGMDHGDGFHSKVEMLMKMALKG